MITFEKAQRLVLDHTSILPSEEKEISDLKGGILAEDVMTEIDLPPFSNSAMDGFALQSDDTALANKTLKIVGCVKAGDIIPRIKVNRGEAVKIMTGAPLPKKADAVIMKEQTEENEMGVVIKKSVEKGENIRFKGEEIKKGQTALQMGKRLNPASLGFLIALGRDKVKVFRKPVVSILVTGDELKPPGSKLNPGSIWESNSSILTAALREVGVEPIFLGIARDRIEDLEMRVKKGLNSSDILLISGGISVGDYDLVQKVLEKLEVKKIFWRVAIKPGKPTYFGKKDNKLVFGLPGNPASVLVTFMEFVRPAVLKMAGHQNVFLEERKAFLVEDMHKKPGRAHFLKGYFQEKKGNTYVRSAGMQNSHILESLSRANCLFLLEKDRTSYKSGEEVQIQLLHWE
jgi:molybdopterin molybdotransferase